MPFADLVSPVSALLTGAPVFTLELAGTPIRVVRFSGHEEISALYQFHLEVAAPEEVDPETFLGQPALLTLRGAELPRLIHGIVCEAEYIGHSRHLQLYELTIMPWAFRLLHQQNCRIFQDKTTEEIVTEVLKKAGLPHEWFRLSLVNSYEKRNYCVQYRETDFAFISRLLEEDGIFYFFEHEASRHVWVMADHTRAHPPIPGTPTVWFCPPIGTVQDREHIASFRFGGRVRAGKVSLRDTNLHRPGQKMEVMHTAVADPDLEVYDFPGEYQDPGRGGPHQGLSMARIRLEALQATRRRGTGYSDCARLTAGHFFVLVGHPRAELNREYRLTHVQHAGNQPQVLDQDAAGASSYHNSFTVTELPVPFRPARTTQRPTVRGVQTATVVGPEHEEVHTDEHGRVRVQFHWDREGLHDEWSSCWVRVSQLWAGNGWGAMFIPRIGHEVLVDFIEGDPDRPIVTGRIYHGLNRTPYLLPDEKTKSTIKSESSIGGGGYNEFRFEDLKGREEVFLHAQRDWNTVILRNHSEQVGANRSSAIAVNETIEVGSNRSVSVGTNDATSVGRVHTVTIAQPADPPPKVEATQLLMRDRYVRVTTGEATITLQGPDILLEADGNISLVAKKAITLTAEQDVSVSAGTAVRVTANDGDLTLEGGPMVKINC